MARTINEYDNRGSAVASEPPKIDPADVTITLTLTVPAFNAVVEELLGKGMFEGGWHAFRQAKDDLYGLGL